MISLFLELLGYYFGIGILLSLAMVFLTIMFYNQTENENLPQLMTVCTTVTERWLFFWPVYVVDYFVITVASLIYTASSILIFLVWATWQAIESAFSARN